MVVATVVVVPADVVAVLADVVEGAPVVVGALVGGALAEFFAQAATTTDIRPAPDAMRKRRRPNGT
jgi:hypothetical protein